MLSGITDMRVLLCTLSVLVFASFQHKVANATTAYDGKIIQLNETCNVTNDIMGGLVTRFDPYSLFAVAGSYVSPVPRSMCGREISATATVGCTELDGIYQYPGYPVYNEAACPTVNVSGADTVVVVTGKLDSAVAATDQYFPQTLTSKVQSLDLGTPFSVDSIKINGTALTPAHRRDTGQDIITIVMHTTAPVNKEIVQKEFGTIKFMIGGTQLSFQDLISETAPAYETVEICADGTVYHDDQHGYCGLNTTNSSWCKAISAEFEEKDCDTLDDTVKHVALTQCRCHDVCHAFTWCNAYVWDNATETTHGDKCQLYPHIFDDTNCADHGYTFVPSPSKNMFSTGKMYELDPDKAMAVGVVGGVGAIASFAFSGLIMKSA